MSSVEVKEQVNRICRLARSFKEMKALCSSANIEAMEINNAMQSARFNVGQASAVFMDFQEMDRLKEENQEMKLLLSDYHRGVELLMDAYRKRVLGDSDEKNSVPADETFDSKLLDSVVQQSNRISEMHNLMQKVAAIDDNAENLLSEQIAFLRKENAVLRELYEISMQFGSAGMPIRNELILEDKFCQTDDEPQIESECNSDEEDAITVISLKFDESDSGDDEDDERKEILKCPGQENSTSDERITTSTLKQSMDVEV